MPAGHAPVELKNIMLAGTELPASSAQFPSPLNTVLIEGVPPPKRAGATVPVVKLPAASDVRLAPLIAPITPDHVPLTTVPVRVIRSCTASGMVPVSSAAANSTRFVVSSEVK